MIVLQDATQRVANKAGGLAPSPAVTGCMPAGDRRSSATSGFTLIELMIVVAIVAILAAIAFPSYQRYLMRGARAAAESFMMDVASRQGQYLLDNRAYAASLTELGLTPPSNVSASYTVVVASPGTNPPSFTVTGTPIGGQVNDSCGTLGLASDGTKSASGTGSCW